MTSAKNVVLTAIKFKGTAQVRTEAAELADNLFCSKPYVLGLCRKVDAGKITLS